MKTPVKPLAEISITSVKKRLLSEPKVELRVKTKSKTGYYWVKIDDVVEIV